MIYSYGQGQAKQKQDWQYKKYNNLLTESESYFKKIS